MVTSSKQSEILDAVLGLLQQGGYAAVTTDAIAANADVSKSTIYRHWPTKSAMMIALIGKVVEPIHVPDLGSFEDEVRYFLEARRHQYAQPGADKVFAGILGACTQDPELAAAFHSWSSQQMAVNLAIVDRAIERGELASTSRRRDITTLIAAPLIFRLIWEQREPDHDLVEFVVGAVKQHLATESVTE